MTLNNQPIQFCLAGANGKMGREVIKALPSWRGIQLVSAVGLRSAGKNLQELLGKSAPSLIISSNLKDALQNTHAKILLDLTEPSSAFKNALSAIELHVAPLIGTSGLQSSELKELELASQRSGIPVMVIPNFSIGANLGLEFSQLASKWLPNVEIIEIHHEQKQDAPSGTAIETAKVIHASRTQPSNIPETKYVKISGSRGGKYLDVPIHSIRLNGVLAQQIVLFGGLGETLEIKHTAIDRSTYMGGIELSLRSILSKKGMSVGLQSILEK